ncbi:hypothetical protein BMH32_15280 [Leucobacter sp. OLJS4]|uniref:hypothetical protein n=1 Tax=unclassified Leucobacter TaxID=2621730 RepID=UPI000C195F4F|nr:MULTISPECIES: hypothetical protein [unclassified Leucobacter]PII81591.1 hypothetical protein BMH25_13790 [Leucobacter sp. OLCALW19]PII86263.1 hypothetical protein BMH26_14220 [Leucobacter sp. OLTLW20]PII90158.1 hypothetical protein BMH27_12385 [Leucobacter sp. OLAS13]PII97191.1 hypothetical protein BMH29_13070 [Leucobacter sp. OLDS2]PIJ01503.1 hypothetical protein BMH28_06465 [Leucobacter sp. OLCS4]
MDWSLQRNFGIAAGVILGALLGLMIAQSIVLATEGFHPRGITPQLIMLPTLLVVILVNLGIGLRMVDRLVTLIAQRSQLLATGAAPGETAPARVGQVFGREQRVAATMRFPASPESARLALVKVLPSGGLPRTAYVLLPTRYGIQRNAPASVVLDPANPDVAVLDDRVDAAVLAAIAADPRWATVRVPGRFLRQGGLAVVIAFVAGLIVSLPLWILFLR